MRSCTVQEADERRKTVVFVKLNFNTGVYYANDNHFTRPYKCLDNSFIT